jgi:hypothetical protein
MRRFSWLWLGGALAIAPGCSNGLPDNGNLSGDACQQLTQAFEGLNQRMTGCDFAASLNLPASGALSCESLLSGCDTLPDGGGDIPQLLAAADCINQIPGGDCGAYPNLAANATVAFAQTCFTNQDTPSLSPSCQVVDAGTSVVSDGLLIAGQPQTAIIGAIFPQALVSWGSDQGPGDAGQTIPGTTPPVPALFCPTPSTVLTGTSTTRCSTDRDCLPTCCLCSTGEPVGEYDGGASTELVNGSYLAAACMNYQCVPSGWVCNVINEQVTVLTGAGICNAGL